MTNIETPVKTTFAQLVLFSMLLILIPRFDAQGATGHPQVAGGGEHTCALIDGGVKCWGRNQYGQLGNGTNTDSHVPIDVAGLTVGVAAISAQAQHTCALMSSGGVKCWGRNLEGQLGNGMMTSSNVPVDVVGLANSVLEIAAGTVHSCVIMTSGELKCWGNNLYGQLGDMTTANRLMPANVWELPSRGSKLALGTHHSCVLMENGGMMCWGRNQYGQLGNGTKYSRTIPTSVPGFTSGVSSLSAGGGHTCLVTDSGGAKCWGSNWRGQVGDDTTTDSSVPVDVSGLGEGVAEISTGTYHTCAITKNGDGYCWGDNFYGQLGDDTIAMRLAPVSVVGLVGNATAIVAGGLHSCAFTGDADLFCWGYNNFGQLGDGTVFRRYVPTSVIWPPVYRSYLPTIGR